MSPALPAGLALSATTGAISGTASAAAALAVYTLTGSDAAGAQVTRELTLTVNPALVATPAIASKVLLSNVVATAFTPVTITGGTSAFVYAITPALLQYPMATSTDSQIAAMLMVSDAQTRELAKAALNFTDGATSAKVVLDLPPELRNRVTRFAIEGLRIGLAAVRPHGERREARVEGRAVQRQQRAAQLVRAAAAGAGATAR